MVIMDVALQLAAMATVGSWARDDVADPAGGLQRAVNAAVASRASKFVVPPGDYRFGNRTFLIADAANIVLTTAGATLWFEGALGGVVLMRCHNVTFQGFALDRDPPPWIEAKVTGSTSRSQTFSIPEGWSTRLEKWYTTGGATTLSPLSYRFPSAPDYDGLPWLDRGHLGDCGSIDFDKVHWTSARTFEHADGCSDRWAVNDTAIFIVWQGFNYVVANSSLVVTDSLVVRASGYIAVAELDGGGAHTYKNVSVVPAIGRTIASTADGFHSSDVEFGPTLEGCRFSRLLDDFFNVQNTFMFVLNRSGTELTVVIPHTNDQLVDGFTDLWYGTSEPLRRLQPGDKLRFVDPLTFAHLGDVAVAKRPQQVPAAAQSALGKLADGLFDAVSSPPYDLPATQPERYPVQHWRSSVYKVTLVSAPPEPSAKSRGLPVRLIVESGRSSAVGARVRNSRFDHSSGLFGRWKSSHSELRGNTFHHFSGTLQLEVQMIPSFYEGPLLITNVTIANNTFFVPAGSPSDASEFIWANTKFTTASGIVVENNTVAERVQRPAESAVQSWGASA